MASRAAPSPRINVRAALAMRESPHFTMSVSNPERSRPLHFLRQSEVPVSASRRRTADWGKTQHWRSGLRGREKRARKPSG